MIFTTLSSNVLALFFGEDQPSKAHCNMVTALPWIALFAPLISAISITLFLQRYKQLAVAVSISACALSFVAAVGIYVVDGFPDLRPLNWLNIPGAFTASIGLLIDPLSEVMLLVVTGIGLLIHIYSAGYMKKDAGKARYYAGLSLFMFSMLGIVLADNFFMMFIFWELVGVSSYTLIGHWFGRESAAEAAKKAFIVNRIGDFGYMLGILMLWSAAGTVVFKDLFESDTLAHLAAKPVYLGTAVLLVFFGAVGKSAQVPLHVWLPDAMEGPTPVSALIHAATMVAAGVFMLVRSFPLIEAAPEFAAETILWVGLTTSVLAALMATQQDDIKRVLAYSTLSQLGYMIMAVGLSAPLAAMFHLSTHAFFKALLFLGAGAVIHMLHHEQNIWKMGGLLRKMPVTAGTFLCATLALMGMPLFSGYFSKHELFAAAIHHSPVVFWLVVGIAALTCFYMGRLFIVVFLSQARSAQASHAAEAPLVMSLPLIILTLPTIFSGYDFVLKNFELFLNRAHEKVAVVVDVAGFAAIGLGLGCATILYLNRQADPLHIQLFARRFFIDTFYAIFVRMVHDPLAKLMGWMDRWILDAVVIRGGAMAVWVTGFVLRLLQIGNLQVYALILAGGAATVLFLIILR